MNKEWPKVLKNLCSAVAVVEEVERVNTKPDELFFVYANFIQPKRHPVTFTIYGEHLNPENTFTKLVQVDQRQEKIGLCFKKVKRTRTERSFQLKESVFG